MTDRELQTTPINVLIGGGGFAGLALAIALRQGLGDSFSVAVADPAFARNGSGDARASAIATAARRLFETIGVWQRVAGEAQPILDMVVTDSRLDDAVRPAFLSFAGEIADGEPFAHMIENGPLLAALLDKARDEGVELRAVSVAGFCFLPPPGRGRSDHVSDPGGGRTSPLEGPPPALRRSMTPTPTLPLSGGGSSKRLRTTSTSNSPMEQQ